MVLAAIAARNTHLAAVGLLIACHCLGSLMESQTDSPAARVAFVLLSESLQGWLFRARNPQLRFFINPHLFMGAAALLMPYRDSCAWCFLAAYLTALVMHTRYLLLPAYRHLDAAAKARHKKQREARH